MNLRACAGEPHVEKTTLFDDVPWRRIGSRYPAFVDAEHHHDIELPALRAVQSAEIDAIVSFASSRELTKCHARQSLVLFEPIYEDLIAATSSDRDLQPFANRCTIAASKARSQAER